MHERKRRMRQGQRREETCEWRRSPDGECRDDQKKLRKRGGYLRTREAVRCGM
jgi:hypothetical protein